MTAPRPAINLLHRYDQSLFVQHFDPVRDGYDVVENGGDDRVWDLVIVFEAIAAPRHLRVHSDRTVFVAGEPPSIGNHSKAFLRQFDAVYCAGADSGSARRVSGEQHYNNWHFGYSTKNGFRYGHEFIRDLRPPQKTDMLSTITSNLAYLPMHIRRRALIDRLAQDYPGSIDTFGRPHRFIEYKDDAILPYRFHLCVENCSVPNLWTEKIADALLGYSVPIYAGCPNIEDYFPGTTISIDLDDYEGTRQKIGEILIHGEAIYRERLPALIDARKNLIEIYDISSLVGELLRVSVSGEVREIALRPEAAFPMAGVRDLVARASRQISKFVWRRRIARHD